MGDGWSIFGKGIRAGWWVMGGKVLLGLPVSLEGVNGVLIKRGLGRGRQGTRESEGGEDTSARGERSKFRSGRYP